jgi:hypothetical protein
MKKKTSITRASQEKAAKEVKVSSWDTLRTLIVEYAEAYVADSWKGGGDPADFEVVEAQFKLALAQLNAHIDKMERELS